MPRTRTRQPVVDIGSRSRTQGLARFHAQGLADDTRPNSGNHYFWAESSPKFGHSSINMENITETGSVVSADFSFVPWNPKK